MKVYETPMVEATAINIPERDAVGFQFDVPLSGLKRADPDDLAGYLLAALVRRTRGAGEIVVQLEV